MALLNLGHADELYAELRWTGRARGSAADVTRGQLFVSLAGTPVWGTKESPLEWTWIELLEHLAGAWPYLIAEQSYPVRLKPANLLHLEAALDEKIAAADVDDDDIARALVHEFIESHDLSRGLQGISVSPLRMLRQGNAFQVASNSRKVHVDAESVSTFLSGVGGAIADRVVHSGDQRSSSVLIAWRSRWESITSELLASIGTGLSGERAEIVKHAIELDGHRLNELDSEVLAAARMAGGFLDSRSLSELLNHVLALPCRPSDDLDQLSASARNVASHQLKDYEQGYLLGAWARGRLVSDPVAAVDIESVLTSLGVSVQDIDLRASEIDAVAIFGPRHGPAVLVNTSGLHSRGLPGRRASLAHELCHLLRDRQTALPFAEAISAAAPVGPERRARAFSAEFLLPQRAVMDEIARTDLGDERKVEALVSKLAKHFNVSRELAAWQVGNSYRRKVGPIPQSLGAYLKQLASAEQGDG